MTRRTTNADIEAMDAIESLKDLLGRYPRLWALRMCTEWDSETRTWHVRLRLYHVANRHAANVSPEAAKVLGLRYDPKKNAIAYRCRAPAPMDHHIVAKLAVKLYGSPSAIDLRRME